MTGCPLSHRALAAVAAILVPAVAASRVGAAEPDVRADVREDWRRQHEMMLGEDGKLLPTEEPLRAVAAHRQAVQPLPGDRAPVDVVLRRTRALLEDLRGSGAQGLDALAGELAALSREAAGGGQDYALYERACALRRRAVFANPLLNMDRIVFVAGRYHGNLSNHHAPSGPGQLLVLREPFGPEPTVVEPLAGAIVENGRHQGRDLRRGCFADPEVSWDGRTLYFAWAQRGSRVRGGPVQQCYTLECTYHIFRADLDADGKATRLRQLTDGAWNDTDPCELPNGRIAFCSGRRGTAIRCNWDGGYPTNNTLFSMEPDGSDQICLSKHETGEWDPSVDQNGMLLYSRWDYMDRTAHWSHNMWTCYPDGRDPRAPHGNYPVGLEGGPGEAKWPDCIPTAELGIRAVPGRQGLYTANTGQRYTRNGTVILIDLSTPDDRGLSQIRVVTPDQRYNDSHGVESPVAARCWYASPWPLSERHFLVAQTHRQCVKAVKRGKTSIKWENPTNGIYYVDVFGNKELLYDTGGAECMDPIPLRARPRPPVIPDATTQSARAKGGGDPASVLILNVYESDFDWPEGTRIKRLRIVQCLPKTTGRHNEPTVGNGYEQQFPRFPLGTVPVMEDGSIWFQAPVGREIYFQALDAQNRAVQSMRSGTYVHPGERMVCAGCHEDKYKTRILPAAAPLAMTRAPGGKPWPIEPDVTDANGGFEVLTFARHIQPILDRRCADCHKKSDNRRAPALHDRTVDQRRGWSKSYSALVSRMFTYYGDKRKRDQDYSRTIAGRFGALAAPLTKHFTPAHHKVKLPPEEWRVVVAWLDCLAPFYGWDWDLQVQQRGEKLIPRIDFDPSNPLAHDRPAAEGSALLAGWTRQIRALQEGCPTGGRPQESSRAAGPPARTGAEIAAEAVKASGEKKAALLEMLALREPHKHVGLYTQAVADENQAVRRCALRVLADYGDAETLPVLIGCVVRAASQDEAADFRRPVGAICARMEDRQAGVAALTAALPKATAAGKCTLLRVLGRVGGAEAIANVQKVLAETSPAPPNLAMEARAAASSQLKSATAAKYAVDGRVPAMGCRADDGAAWAVSGKVPLPAALTLEWDQPVEVAEVVYYGRTAWDSHECWKDYELYVDDVPIPSAKGRFSAVHGPQRVRLPGPVTVRRLTLKLLTSHGGANPGASEIKVFSQPVKDLDAAEVRATAEAVLAEIRASQEAKP